MILKKDYEVLKQFIISESPQISSLNSLVLNRLLDCGLLQKNDTYRPNPEPEKTFNGKFLDKIVSGYELGISEEGKRALLEYEEEFEEKDFHRSNVKKANTRSTIALIIAALSLISSTLISLLKK